MDYLFSPSAESLISRYLRPKIAGEPHDASSFMHDADVYTDHPYELVRNRAPALGTGDGDGRIWYFFSPVRYVGGKNTSGRRGGSRKRSRTVGANGKLGTWHSEGKKKTMEGSAAGGYVENFSYHERTASGFVKPGWLMVEYGILEEDGGCNIVLCKVYKSPRGPGSDVPFPRTSASSGRKRKADIVEHLEAPRTPSFWLRERTHGGDDDCMLFADSLERDLSDDRAAPAYQESEPMSGGKPAVPAYQETQHMSGGGEPSASAFQETEHVSGGEAQLEPSAGDLSGLPWLRQFMETDEDEVVVQLPHDFSYERYLLGDDQQGAVLPSAAQTEDAAVTCAQTSQHGPPTEEDVIEFSLDELMGSSVRGACSGLPNLIIDDDDDVMLCGLSCPLANDDKIELMDDGVTAEELLASSTPGECSTLPSLLTDDDVMVCGLVCPPMDRACVKQLFSVPPERFDPSYVEELLSDL